MKVRLRLAWQSWPKGHVFTEMPAAQAEVMVATGRAEYVRDEPAVSAAMPAPVDRMMRPAAVANRFARPVRRPA